MNKLIITLIILLAAFMSACTQTSQTQETIIEDGKMSTAIIETNKGTIKVELFTEQAPITTENFMNLIKENFYDGILFHRVEPGFVIQVGDPQTKTMDVNHPAIGSGGSKKTIKLEVNPELKHGKAGVLSMARTNDPNSATSQFFITLGDASFLDMQYAVFGEVTEGLDVIQAIKVGDKIEKVTLE